MDLVVRFIKSKSQLHSKDPESNHTALSSFELPMITILIYTP